MAPLADMTQDSGEDRRRFTRPNGEHDDGGLCGGRRKNVSASNHQDAWHRQCRAARKARRPEPTTISKTARSDQSDNLTYGVVTVVPGPASPRLAISRLDPPPP
jgi:hypothetical protein